VYADFSQESTPAIDSDVGTKKADTFRYYKQALFHKYTEDWAFDDALAEVKPWGKS